MVSGSKQTHQMTARDGGILEERNYYDALENFVDDSAMLKYKRKERRNTNVRVEAACERKEGYGRCPTTNVCTTGPVAIEHGGMMSHRL